LADFLPKIDQTFFSIDRSQFIDAISVVARFLNNPEWLVYQWGSFRPFDAGLSQLLLGLTEVVNLGIQLQALCDCENFESLLEGFLNPTQFQDTLFETKVAFFFYTLPSVYSLKFAQEYTIRGRIKRPEFVVSTNQGLLCVECKRPHLYAQKALLRLHRVADYFKSAISQQAWPRGLRLEVEITGPLRGNVTRLAFSIVEEAITEKRKGETICKGPFKYHALDRSEDFKLPSAPWHTDTMVLDQDIPVGLLDPNFTQLRVADYNLDSKFKRSVGSRINEALRQLPETESCMIFLGEVSPRIAQPVCLRRIDEQAYAHIRAFAIYEDTLPTLVFRKSDFTFINRLFKSLESTS